MSDSPSRGDSRGTRLDSWKAIAGHLGRSVRTAQRWEKEFGLPVHHLGGESGSVYGYSDEIYEWFRNFRRDLQIENLNKPALVQMPERRPHVEPSARAQTLEPFIGSSRERSRCLVADAYEMWPRLTEHNLHFIARLFREAIDINPGNAEAYAGLSHALIAQAMMGNVGVSTAFSAALAAADKALGLDPELPDAKCAKGWLNVLCRRDWKAARLYFERVLREGPGTTRTRVGRALLHVAEGNCGAGSTLLYEVAQEDLLSSFALGLHAWCEYLAGSYSEVMDHISEARQSGHFGPLLSAVEALAYAQFLPTHEAIGCVENLMNLDSRNDVVCGVLGYLRGMAGDEDQAFAMLKVLNERRSHANEPAHYALALTQAGLNEKEAAIQSIKRSYESGSLWSLGFHLDPAFQPLTDEISFKQFVGRAYPEPGIKAESEIIPFDLQDIC